MQEKLHSPILQLQNFCQETDIKIMQLLIMIRQTVMISCFPGSTGLFQVAIGQATHSVVLVCRGVS